MQGKIQIAAPDDACFGKKRSQMLHRIQPFYSRKCDHSAGWRIFTRNIKEQLLPTVAVHFGKQTVFEAEPRKLLYIKGFLCFTTCQHGDAVHSIPSLLPLLMLSACQYTDMQMFFKPFGTKA